MRPLERSKIHKILVISLTNIGDVVLTFPVIDILAEEFAQAQISVVIGPKARSLLQGNPHLKKVHIFDKHQPPLRTLAWIRQLRRERFDLVVDLRNTAIPLMITPRYRTSCRMQRVAQGHMRSKHLERLRSVYKTDKETGAPKALFIPDAVKDRIRTLINQEIGDGQKFVVVAAGAADQAKRWPEEQFAAVCRYLTEHNQLKIVFVGDDDDRKVTQRAMQFMATPAVNLCGRTDLVQLAELLKYCALAIVNDSAPMHLASYLNVPVLALFGPSDPVKYGPWGQNSRMIKKDAACPACREPRKHHAHICLRAISSDEVIATAQEVLGKV